MRLFTRLGPVLSQDPFTRANTLVVAALGLVLLITGSFIWGHFSVEQTARKWSEHNFRVLDTIKDLEIAVRDAEVGHLTYVATGDAADLAVFETARERVNGLQAELARLTVDRAARPDAMLAAAPMLVDRMQVLDQTVRIRHDSGAAEALRMVRSDVGRASRQRLDASLAGIISDQQRLIAERAAEVEAHSFWVRWSILWGGVFAGLTLIWAARVIVRDREARRRHEADRTVYEERLENSNAQLKRLTHKLELARDLAERESRAKSRFLAGMSHELRTPLNGILGYAQLLRLDTEPKSLQSARLDAMLEAGKHLLQMIHCVLDLSQFETEQVELQVAAVDLRRLAAACVDLVRPAAEGKSLTLVLSVASDVPHHVETDPIRLRQVLLNLLGNAVKFTARGSVDLRIRCMPGEKRLRFEVADTGPGIPAEHRNRLFQDFARLDVDATRAVEGAGLGLAISARLAILMGGPLGYEDNPGGGSLFWMELPLVAATNVVPDETVDEAPVEAGGKPMPALRVLVVDDIAMNRDIAGSFIRSAGHDVICVEDGAAAVAAVKNSDFDLVMMDVRMPIMDGLEATRRIRMLGGERGQVSIVAMTAQAFAEQVAECRAAGMDGHVAKPFTLNSLLDAVAQGVAAGELRRAAIILPEAAAPIAAPVAPPAPPVKPPAALAADPAIFDPGVFERTAAFLNPEVIAAHLTTLADRSEALLRGLQESGALAASDDALGESAHALAGSAGMFGFERLALVARYFDRAVKARASDARGRAEELIATLQATVPEMRSRASVVVDA